MSANAVPDRFDIPPHVFCPSCSTGFEILEEFTHRYFRDEPITCPSCSARVDWWQAILSLVAGKQEFFLFNAIGAKQIALKKELRPMQPLEVDFELEGLPPDGRIVYINYTPNGPSLFPAEQHGNAPRRHGVPRKVRLFPVPQAGHCPENTPLSILFTWVPGGAGDSSWESLVDAFEAYSTGRFETFVVPANVAVESRLNKVMAEVLSRTCNKRDVAPFLRNNAPYGPQLNVLLPAILRPRGFPVLRDEIRARLNRLRDLRNKLAHSGRLGKPLVQPEAGELLCASFFGFHYMKFIEGRLGEEGKGVRTL